MQVPQFQPGDIYFVMHNGEFLAEAIAWFMKNEPDDISLSHCGMVAVPTTDYTFVSEVSDFAVTVGWIELYIQDPTASLYVFRIKPQYVPGDTCTQMVTACMGNYNKLYGYLQMLSMMVRLTIMKLSYFFFNKLWKIPNFIRLGLLCDEQTLTGVRLSSVPGLQGIDPKSIETLEFYKALLPYCDVIYTK